MPTSPPEDVAAIAGALADRPCSIQVGWGMGRRMNGSAIVRALDALGAVSGNLGIPGGGVSFYFKRRGAFDFSHLAKSYPRAIPEPLLGQGILDAKEPPIRAVWVTAGNPVVMLPDSATVARALRDAGARRRGRLVPDRHRAACPLRPADGDARRGRRPPRRLRTPLARRVDARRRAAARTSRPTSKSSRRSPGRIDEMTGEKRPGDFFDGKRDRPGMEGEAPLAGRAARHHRRLARARTRPQPSRRKGALRGPEVRDRHRAGEARPYDCRRRRPRSRAFRSGSSRTRRRNPRAPSGPARPPTPSPRPATRTRRTASRTARASGSRAPSDG